MTSWVLLLAASSVGIEAGWKPLATGGHEYTVQIEPELVRLLETGNDLVSEVPSEIHVRSLRITVGKGGVARIEGDAAPTAAAPSAPPAVAAATPHDDLPTFGIDTALPPPPTDPVPDAVTHAPAESKDQPTPAAKEHSLAATDPPAPDSLPPSDAQAHPLSASPAGFSESPQEHKSEKPSLGGAPGATSAGAPTPWVPFLIAAVLLCCSLGANFYLGWIAWDARNRYRAAVTKLRPAAA
jgi:hypothetical protein